MKVTKKKLDRVMKALFNTPIDEELDESIPEPTQEDLERKFRMDFTDDGRPVIREVKD